MNYTNFKMHLFYETHRMVTEGYKISQIAEWFASDPRTVRKYLRMTEEEFYHFLANQTERNKKLSPYWDFVRQRLEDWPQASSAQVHDWLKEHYDDLPEVSEKTVYSFVQHIRLIHDIPKLFSYRQCQKIPELPYGKQAQVDFGEYNMTTIEGKRKKVYFFTMVLSRSRQKFVHLQENPFTSEDTAEAHELAFEYYQGIPKEVVYDQDKVLLFSENHGELKLTSTFKKYHDYRGFNLFFCRKADPQSKGKIENVVKYIKYNFLRGRRFNSIEILNREAIKWLERKANAKVHAGTRKVPKQEWEIEKQHLNEMKQRFKFIHEDDSSTVRKDNTVLYQGNYYQLPIGTYQGDDTCVKVEDNDGILLFFDDENKQIANLKRSYGKGQLIRNNNYVRDHSMKINELIEQSAMTFSNKEMAQEYFDKIRKAMPRYTRDQVSLICKACDGKPNYLKDQALEYCYSNNIFRATDFKAVLEYFDKTSEHTKDEKVKLLDITTSHNPKSQIKPDKSNINDYNQIIND